MAENEIVTRKLILENLDDEPSLLGPQNRFIEILEEGLEISINVFGTTVKISGDADNSEFGIQILNNMLDLIHGGITLHESDFVSAMKMAANGTLDYFQELYNQVLMKDIKGNSIRVKNFGQRQYIQAIQHNDITFGIGPAGTGKTYLAVVMAISELKKGNVDRIVLTRPAVEAGESLGFLPGDLKEKVDPYLRPIYDALFSILGREHTQRLIERNVIEIAPLAYMRGRTLDNAFAILDEAQNTTNAQMKMFVTRLGFGSKMIVNGDVSQIDLPRHTQSGLILAESILKTVNKIQFVKFTSSDVVRHPVVARIINAYDRYQNEAQKNLFNNKNKSVNSGRTEDK